MFVPRAVKKKQAAKLGQAPSSLAAPAPPPGTAPSTSTSSTSSLPSPSPSVLPPARQPTATDVKPLAKASLSEAKTLELQAVALLELVFSDHALWTKDDLHLVARSNQNEGYIPLNFLLANHPLLSFIATLPHPTLTRALRQHGTPGLLRTRLALTEPRAWGGTKSYGEPGIEVGRCDWGSEEARSGKRDEPWEERTIYLESLPPHLRSYPQVLLYLNSLFHSSSSNQPVVQSLSFDGLVFRNFVWIVLRDEEALKSVQKEWSWDGAVARGKRAAKEVEGVSKETEEGRDAGLRVLKKVEHSRLQQEYVAHLATFPSTSTHHPSSTSISAPAFVHDQPPHTHTSIRTPTHPYTSSYNPPKATSTFAAPPPQFPSSCLLYLKNVDPQTSKTALHTLFNSLLPDGKEIDYVDWVKGSDSCHLRISTPSHTSHLLKSLTSTPIYHISPSDPPILPELISGERERIYWMDIKESIRFEAVRIAALDLPKSLNGSSSSNIEPTSTIPTLSRSQLSSDYPPGCLVFAKGLDPDSCSKTSLKELFNAGLRSDETNSKGMEVTYVDWSKGLDTCYLRLPHPSLAPLLLSYFSSSDLRVALELVEGERESIYWRTNVKESIRREAAKVAAGEREREGKLRCGMFDSKEEAETTTDCPSTLLQRVLGFETRDASLKSSRFSSLKRDTLLVTSQDGLCVLAGEGEGNVRHFVGVSPPLDISLAFFSEVTPPRLYETIRAGVRIFLLFIGVTPSPILGGEGCQSEL
ncbi:hypothetical protein BDY24DRAFT_411914 [Mrakia frigida]|uniref:uncharacterized protein n=1 Tax=Mrakia frigida TaxID=29902 RepID=UPI003FCC0E5A